MVSLTTRGRAIEAELLTILKAITDRLFMGFDDREIDGYFSQTERLEQNLEKMIDDKQS